MKLALVGATGLVGSKMLDVLAERNIAIDQFYPVASEKSVGKTITYCGKEYPIVSIDEAIAAAPDFALFSFGGENSLHYAPLFAEKGTIVIDNSSAWRMNEEVPLVVPEINATTILPKHKIIANPNCSTIQMVMVLFPLHLRYGIERVVVSTYQSVTGTGVKAVNQLHDEMKQDAKEGHYTKAKEAAYAHPIHKNCIPQIDVFLANGYTKEEMKMIGETKKIMQLPQLRITATTVRVPTVGGHAESVNVTFKNPIDLQEIKNILKTTTGVLLVDDPLTNTYPMPIDSQDKDDVLVGRVRIDESLDNSINMWIVADNLRKGAATNAVQILEFLLQNTTH